ncbi:hypothetical protein TVAG_478170 [Trichomonas vaginalis G3]|uniref:Uncharacterized protein n=1 Tax=Trichomonas vaginalis (strain ATCC PRA-98 / G3) TaxID=412133 RepID=A2FZW1_TRIV3|nr:hypothetical protein TVAG_478170 [Trichomonas vaginalis G3]|eukprot:XP_001302490.1 hypothetical protein [Trichomonas vaginalis G3]
MDPTLPDLEPDLEWASANIQQYIDNGTIADVFSIDQLLVIFKKNKFNIPQANQIFMCLSNRFSPSDSFRIFRHMKIKLKNNGKIHEFLTAVNAALKAKHLAEISKYYFQLYNENSTVCAQNKLLSDKLSKLQDQMPYMQDKNLNEMPEINSFQVDENNFRTAPNIRYSSTLSSHYSSDNNEILPNDIISLKSIIQAKNDQIKMMKSIIKFKDDDIATQLTSIQHLASQLSKFMTESCEDLNSQLKEKMKIIESDIELLKQQHNNQKKMIFKNLFHKVKKLNQQFPD